MNESSAAAVESALPQGTVTILFTDIEGSTRLLRRLGQDYAEVLGVHRRLLRDAFSAHRGREVDTQGDAFFVAFSGARDAIAAAVQSQRALHSHRWLHGEPVLVRMGIHTGEPVVLDGHYVGMDVHRAARICGAAHGGQVVVSEATHRLVANGASEDIGFRDLGPHRLKDLDRAERLLQVVAEGLPVDFPPLKTAEPRTNVPKRLSELVGRREEMEELVRSLREEETRLVTLTGAGGSGKTRLSAAVALEVLDVFPDGVFFVDVTSLRDQDLVISSIGQTLGTSLDEDRGALESIAEHIGAKRLLLVLDNFEQALAGAGAISKFLRACPELKIMVTSRVRLSLEGEREYRLSPLELPEEATAVDVARSEAGQLFVERATAARPSFRLTEDNAPAVAEICRLLDGLPLAIELAAARVRLLSPEALLARLDDRLKLLTGGLRDSPVRQRALRTTIDWSYDLLSQRERDFFRDLAVFRGSATVDAIEHVMGHHAEPLEALTALVDHSLVRESEDPAGEVRFGMLQTIREYALELLATDPGRASLHDRHAHYFLELAEATTTRDDQHAATLSRTWTEHDNMRSALDWWLQRASEDPETYGGLALRLASSLGHHWYRRGHAVEGSAWLQRALEVAAGAPQRLRADALRLLGVLMEQRRHLDGARELFEEALVYYRDSGDREGESKCLNSLGVVARSRQDLERAEDLFAESLALRRDLGDRAGIGSTLGNLAIVALDRLELDRAEALLEEALEVDRERGDDWGVACTSSNLGVVHLERNEVARARSTIEEAMRLFLEQDDLDGVAESMEGLAGVAAAERSVVRAARLAGAADAVRRRLGIPLASADRERLERWLALARDKGGESDFEKAWSEGARMTAGQAVRYALGEAPTGAVGTF